MSRPRKGPKDWNEAIRAGMSPLQAADSAWAEERKNPTLPPPKPDGKVNGKANGIHAANGISNKAIDKALDEIEQWVKKPSFWEGEAEEPEIDWLVENLLPASGVGLLSGQWGMFKTFVLLDLGAALSMGSTFAGRAVQKRGGMLIFAAEGSGAFPRRLKGLRQDGRLTGGPASIAWRPDCPTLTAQGAADIIVAIAERTRAEMKERTGEDLVAIAIDTVAATAGWKNEDSSAEAAAVFSVLQEVHKRTGCVVIGVDHFGKAVETGTRGSSGKEAAADFVLALLGTRDLNGKVTDCKLAVRKLRDGETGLEVPFEARLLEMVDDYSVTRTTRVIDWQTTPDQIGPKKPKWPGRLSFLKRALDVVLADHGQRVRPFGSEGPEVLAVEREPLRKEFMAIIIVRDDAKPDAKRKAFYQATKDAVAGGLLAFRSRDDGTTLFWEPSQQARAAPRELETADAEGVTRR
jgi:hypothetical protein